jgi:subtilase family protein
VRNTLLACLCMWALAGCAVTSSLKPGPEPERLVVVTLRNPDAPVIPRAGSTVRGYEGPASYTASPAARADARALARTHELREIAAWPIGLLGVHCLVFELPAGARRDEVIEQLRRDRRVESAQAYQSFHTLSARPNDPYRGLQRNLDLLNVPGAHRWSRGEGVRIAVIDTGVDARHPDLAGRVARQENFVDGPPAAAADRHGTAVAGVIAAVENNREGIIGIAPQARLYSLRACWPQPEDAGAALCSTLTLAKAIAAAVESHMEIVNLSLSGPDDALLTRLVQVGLRRGVVFVGAAPSSGNGGFPTGIDGVIGVGASGSGSPADASLFAPGSEILTLVPDGRYDFQSGSSLAAASVSAGIALLLARDRNLRGEHVRQLLARSSRMVSTGQGEVPSVNLCAALAELIEQHSCTDGSAAP